MIFAIPAAVQTASLAAKILGIVTIVTVLIGIGFYGGKRWEVSNTMAVQAAYDKLAVDTDKVGKEQETKAKLDNQRNVSLMEKANEQNNSARADLELHAAELRKLKAKSSSGSIMPRPSTDPGSLGLTCFDGAELIAADGRYREGEAARRERIQTISKKGSEATADLNSAKLWKKSLQKQ